MFIKSLVCIISFFIAFTLFQSLYKNFVHEINEFKGPEDVLGKTCSTVMHISGDGVGHAEVASKKGAPLKIMVKSSNNQVIDKREPALVLCYDENTKVYTIESFDYNLQI